MVSLADALGVPPALAAGAWYARKLGGAPAVVVLSDALAADREALLSRLSAAAGPSAALPEVLSAAEFFPRFYRGAAPRVAELFEQLQARFARSFPAHSRLAFSAGLLRSQRRWGSSTPRPRPRRRRASEMRTPHRRSVAPPPRRLRRRSGRSEPAPRAPTS